MTSKTITGIVSWLRGWFYTKDEIVQKEGALQTQINNKASQSDFNTLSSNVANKLDASDYVVDNSLSDSSTNPVQNKVINTALSSKADSSDVPHNTSDLVNDGEDGTTPFVSDNDSRLSDARTPTSHTHGYIENDGTFSTSSSSSIATFNRSNYPLVRDYSDGKIRSGSVPTNWVRGNEAYGNIGSSATATQRDINSAIDTALSTINTNLSGKASSSHTHSSADVTEASALSHIGTSANATQHDINSAIDTAISNLTGADITKVVTTLPTASASTQNALYLLSSNGQYDIYITIEDNGSYSWEKLDDDVLSDLSIDWSDIENIPSTFTPSSHTHGYINNDGTLNDDGIISMSVMNFPIVRDNSDGKIKGSAISVAMVQENRAYSNIGSSATANQYTINGKIDSAIGNINDSVDGKRNIQRAYTSNANNVVGEGHYYTLGGIVNNGQNQGMSFLDVMVDDYDRIVQVCYEYDYGETPDNDVHQYIRYSTNNGSTWSAWKRFVEEDEVVSKADKSSVIDWDTLTFVAKADDETGAITFDYLE